MFSCMHDQDSLNVNTIENGTVARIVEEAEKLKIKCKSLRTLLLETETKRCEEKKTYESQIEQLKYELDTGIAALQSQKFVELCEMRDYRTNEVNELNDQLDSAHNEVSMQGALIIALTRKVTYLEKQIEEAQIRCKEEIESTKREYNEEMTRLSLLRDSSSSIPLKQHQQQHTVLLRRAMAAEAEVARLKATTGNQAKSTSTDGDATKEEAAQLREAVELLRTEKRKMADELLYLREENNRLERQAELLSADLQRHLRQTSPNAGPAAKLTSPKLNQCSPLAPGLELESERRERRAAEEQVTELRARLQEVLGSRATVELAVRGVMGDNERLAREVEALSEQLQRAPQARRPV